MNPRPDHGEESYRGSGRLAGKAAVVTGADSGIGRAVAIAFARELIGYLDDHDDARETARWVEQAGRKGVLVPGDLAEAAHCRSVIGAAVAEFGGVDVLVSNAAQQMTHDKLEDISDEDPSPGSCWRRHAATWRDTRKTPSWPFKTGLGAADLR